MERKTFELAGFVDDGNGAFSGYASVFDMIDSGRDVVARGAFAKAIPAFLRDGFISDSHDWAAPVAMPVLAHEDERGLWIAGVFHSTPDAQRVRTIVRERQAKKLRTGLSIGYMIEDLAPLTGGGRILKTINPLLEVGIVTVPMNREANVLAVKRLDPSCNDDACVLAELRAVERADVKATPASSPALDRELARYLADEARRLGVAV